MKATIYFALCFLLLTLRLSAQKDSSKVADNVYPVRKVTIEPAIGLETSQMFDLIISNLVQWNIKKQLGIISYTSYSYNNIMNRDFNYIKTNYNYALSQKFGIGTSLTTKHSSHTLSFVAGIRYDAYKETLENPDFENVSASVSSVSPDLGLLYNLKIGKKKYFFSYRMYIPMYPYPVISSYIWSLSDNMSNLSFEFGLGIRLK
jgi:outer membrane receptor protein involved in Fe transport